MVLSLSLIHIYPLIGNGTLYRPYNYTPDLKWETTTTYNIGVDFGIMDQRLTASIDAYYRKTCLLYTSRFQYG